MVGKLSKFWVRLILYFLIILLATNIVLYFSSKTMPCSEDYCSPFFCGYNKIQERGGIDCAMDPTTEQACLNQIYYIKICRQRKIIDRMPEGLTPKYLKYYFIDPYHKPRN